MMLAPQSTLRATKANYLQLATGKCLNYAFGKRRAMTQNFHKQPPSAILGPLEKKRGTFLHTASVQETGCEAQWLWHGRHSPFPEQNSTSLAHLGAVKTLLNRTGERSPKLACSKRIISEGAMAQWWSTLVACRRPQVHSLRIYM